MNDRRLIIAMGVILLFIACALVFIARADEINEANGVVNVGDIVIYLTDDDNDGLFEKNPAIVIDDTRAAAALFNQPVEAGQRVNLRIFANGKSRVRDFEVFLVKRGRALGQYEFLKTSNH